MKLGLVTYQLARDWDLDRLLDTCAAHGFLGVELRTTHAHGVETTLSPEARRRVRNRFEQSPVELVEMGSLFEYHMADRDEVRRHVQGTKEYVRLAADVGAPGVKVRPNSLVDGVPEDETLRQIGGCLAEVAEDAASVGVEIRVEMHGPGTSDPNRMKRILDYADHPNACVCWNSNHDSSEVVDGSIRRSFDLLADRIRVAHIHDLCSDAYPWLELFRLLRERRYDGYCLAEIPASDQPERIMDYYRTVWDAFQRLLDLEGIPR
ncbi:MAG: sugar phosphate isomerase/epimerase [Candidatus Brocadiaceae bacterium]|nr:sugar phosphate isomerase/epimerase [Candidatus Brocadiaceae bacterium]